MTEFYRFRSVEQLLGEYAELENQTIFFAAMEDLNDPMEGFRDIVWSGDRIVWLNLFKDYVNCLYWGYSFVVAVGPQFPYDLPVRQAWTWNRAPSPQASQQFAAIWERARDELQLSQFADALEKNGRKVRKDELAHYLGIINLSVSGMILQAFFDAGMLTPPKGMNTSSKSCLFQPRPSHKVQTVRFSMPCTKRCTLVWRYTENPVPYYSATMAVPTKTMSCVGTGPSAH